MTTPLFDAPSRGRRREIDLTPWLDDAKAQARFRAKVYDPGLPDACMPWLRTISSSGHGEFHLGPGGSSPVRAHRFAWLLHTRGAPPPVVMHHCDEHSCVNPHHLLAGTVALNTLDYYRRGRHGGSSPLADPRGRQQRAEAIKRAINEAETPQAKLIAYRRAIEIPRPWREQAGQLAIPAPVDPEPLPGQLALF
ncbi:hypothetical protein [Catellatospora sp. NPDC049133]|uniref:hypothetical protein n=1 Tax=Catellatospora sp. NPDC049133 TaxID=3155499 RepID=UPI0033FD8153